ncbi:MAG: tetratricopeptide repeat protein [Bacteroidia bacterium]|jgi:serine phosphatase RsbU (regulator of sigma subunit)|nr:tetratricopeptide repeat protein [Bacteroidia bacterium]
MKKLVLISIISLSLLNAQTPYLDSLKNIFRTAKHDTLKGNALLSLIANEFDDKIWPGYNKELEKIALRNLTPGSEPKSRLDFVYTLYLANVYSNYGFCEYYMNTNSEKAMQCFDKSLEYNKLIKNEVGEADIYNYMSVVLKNQGDLKKSMEYNFKALGIKEKLNDKQGIAAACVNLGKIYFEQKNFKKAEEMYRRSSSLYKDVKNADGHANTLNSLAHLYCQMEKYDSALINYKQAYDIVEKIGDKYAMSGVMVNIGEFYYKYGDPACDSSKQDCRPTNLAKAKECFERSLAIAEENKSVQGICAAKNHLAWLAYRFGNYKEGKTLSLASLELAKKLKFPAYIRNSSELLYIIERKEGNFEKSLEYYQQYIVMRDSVRNTEHTKELLKKELEYDYLKKKEIDKANNDKELAISEERENNQKLVSIFVGIGLVLVLVFAVIIFNRLRVTNKQKKVIEEKNHVIEEKQKEILDSIHYAKRIQETILAHKDFINDNLPSNFIYYKPKDIVSGDFYWATKKGEHFYLAVCDSTGHGVPGAFMSLLNIGFLNEAITEKNILEPNEIFNYVRERLVNSISREGQKDGFDGALLCIDTKNKKITYTAANVNPVVISSAGVTELPSNRMPVGKGEIYKPFELHTVELKQGETLYVYTDGFADQFGGPRGKKFKYKQLNELLTRISKGEMKEQLDTLNIEFEQWRGALEQVDDVCIIGLSL